MAFQVPPKGSRGTRVPGGAIMRLGTAMVAGIYRLSGGRLDTGHKLILTTVGAKSGKKRTASVRRFEEGDGRWLVVGSIGGAARNPAWVYNLAEHSDRVRVEIGRDRFEVRPELLTGAERAAAWQRIVTEAPQFCGYQQATDREIPVIRLTREL